MMAGVSRQICPDSAVCTGALGRDFARKPAFKPETRDRYTAVSLTATRRDDCGSGPTIISVRVGSGP
jgi:hypothetical protein